MTDSRATSTLELVNNEQQMSQIDLRPSNQQQAQQSNQNSAGQTNEGFSFERLQQLPQRFRSALNDKLDEAKLKSDSQCDYIFKVIHEILSILIWLLCFICTVIIPIIFLFLGLFNFDKCPDRVALPYLVFSIGFVMTMSNIFNLALSLDLPILHNHEVLSADLKNIIASILNVMLNCLALFLYIICAYMVFTLGCNSNENETNIEATPNCSPFLYNFTFWFMSLTLSITLILCFFAFGLFLYNRYRLALLRGSTTNP